MSIAAMIRRMGEAGATPEAIAIAVEEIEGIQGMLEARRTADRDRKRAQRERQKQADVTGHSEDSHGTVTDEPLSPAPSFPPDPQTNPTPIPVECYTPARDGNPFPKPEWADPQVWRDFLANRKAKRLKNTHTAYGRFLSEIARWQCPEWPPPRLLEEAAARGWGGIYNPREDRGNGTSNRGGNGRGPSPDPTLAMVRAANAAERQDGGDHWQARASLPPGQFGGP